MSDDLLLQAIALCRAGKKSEAQPLLEEVLTAQPRNEIAWLWLADCQETLDERIEVLESFVEVVPEAKRAQNGLEALRRLKEKETLNPPLSAAETPAAPTTGVEETSPGAEAEAPEEAKAEITASTPAMEENLRRPAVETTDLEPEAAPAIKPAPAESEEEFMVALYTGRLSGDPAVKARKAPAEPAEESPGVEDWLAALASVTDEATPVEPPAVTAEEAPGGKEEDWFAALASVVEEGEPFENLAQGEAKMPTAEVDDWLAGLAGTQPTPPAGEAPIDLAAGTTAPESEETLSFTPQSATEEQPAEETTTEEAPAAEGESWLAGLETLRPAEAAADNLPEEQPTASEEEDILAALSAAEAEEKAGETPAMQFEDFITSEAQPSAAEDYLRNAPWLIEQAENAQPQDENAPTESTEGAGFSEFDFGALFGEPQKPQEPAASVEPPAAESFITAEAVPAAQEPPDNVPLPVSDLRAALDLGAAEAKPVPAAQPATRPLRAQSAREKELGKTQPSKKQKAPPRHASSTLVIALLAVLAVILLGIAAAIGFMVIQSGGF